MKIVLDTNVFISGIFFSGPPFQVLEAWRDGKIQLVISPAILEEYRRVADELAERCPRVDLIAILELVTINSELVLTVISPMRFVTILMMTSFWPVRLPAEAKSS